MSPLTTINIRFLNTSFKSVWPFSACLHMTHSLCRTKNVNVLLCLFCSQLKKDTVGSKVQWTAGCTTNCSAQTPCKTSTQPPCHLECCNATMTSCLWLNGTLNFPSSATRGPYLHTELITCLLCLLAIMLMLWMWVNILSCFVGQWETRALFRYHSLSRSNT